MSNKKLTILDETLREGMQYQGVMFSLEQRLEILEFQEKLGVDLCQAGYPPAHPEEAAMVKALCRHARDRQFRIRVAGMGRATVHDAKILLETRLDDFHFHFHIPPGTSGDALKTIFKGLETVIETVRDKNTRARISLAMLDIGRSDAWIMDESLSFADHLKVNILSLPDTSGMMAPQTVFDTIKDAAARAGNTRISIHCHNDMGMASANSIMGITAGGTVLEAAALGIGERNGIADLFTTAKMLKAQGLDMTLNTEDIDTFLAYYTYVDTIVHEQTGIRLLTPNTPFFGNAVKTHVAGTHARGEYGMAPEEAFHLNVLCGRHLVKRFLQTRGIECPEALLQELTAKIKSRSVEANRRLDEEDVKNLITSLIRSSRQGQ